MMPSAASAPCSARLVTGGNRSSAPDQQQEPAAPSAKVDASATTRREAESAASSGTTTSQIAANEPMPPVSNRDRGDEPGERQRREHVRALVLAGAREEIGDQDRRDQPGEDHDFEHARNATHAPDRPGRRRARPGCRAAAAR